MLQPYFRRLYLRTMDEAYGYSSREIIAALGANGECLDCGASGGNWYKRLHERIGITKDRYHGIEWNKETAASAQEKGLNVICSDLNKPLPYENGKFTCIFGLSVVEHLLNPCHFINECHRKLIPGGKLILLTPNISTYFTALLILAGRMPSSGPHPDSESLVASQEVYKVSSENQNSDAESETPSHRHLVVFSYRALREYLDTVGFISVKGRGFGLYPFPNFTQPLMERIDPYHCHQMVFTAVRRADSETQA